MSRFEDQLAAITQEIHRQDQALATAQQAFTECLASDLNAASAIAVPGDCVDAIHEAFQSSTRSTSYNFGAIRA